MILLTAKLIILNIKEEKEVNEYSNTCLSEYVTCHILESLGLNVQKTLLGTYSLNGKEKIVVACKDFTASGNVLKQFVELKNSQIESSKNGYGTELEEVIETIEMQAIYGEKKLKDFFTICLLLMH